MRTLGLIGGMSAESTLSYYQIINRETNRRLGGNHSARLLLHSVDFEDVVRLQKAGDWAAAGALLADCARGLAHIGAEALLVCTNTMHKVAPAISAAVEIPLIHVVDVTADAIRAQGLRRVALLGTRFTMSDGFYHERMAAHGIDVLTPAAAEQDDIHRIIFDELCVGRIDAASRRRYQDIIAALARDGAQGVIFGCTEIGLLLAPADSPLPVFDSTVLHAMAAVDWALAA